MRQKNLATTKKELSNRMEIFRRECEWYDQHGYQLMAGYFADLWTETWIKLISAGERVV